MSILALAHAAHDEVGEQAKAAPQESAAPAGSKQSDDIIVIGRRGEAAVPAETEFNEADIAADGSDSIRELLSNLQPFIDPNGTEPVILINGRPAGFDTSILSYPVEALTRVAVLKPEAGARYGAKTGARVVNLVLKSKFASIEAEAGINAATAGGQYGGGLGAMRSAINGDTRWNARVRVDRQSALLKSARRIPRRADELDYGEFDGGEIDPTLEHLVTAASQEPSNPADFETLQPSNRNVTLGINVVRPLGSFTASLSLDAARSDSNGLRGIPMVPLALPAQGSWSSNEAAILLDRTLAGARALRNDNSVQTLGASLTLTGAVRGVQTSLAASFSNSDSHDLLETGADTERLAQLIEFRESEFQFPCSFRLSFPEGQA